MSHLNKTNNYATNILKFGVNQLNEIEQICAYNRSQGDRGLEINNWLQISLQCAEMMSVYLLHSKDKKAAKEALKNAYLKANKAYSAFNHYDTLGEVGAGPIHRTDFPYGITAAWLNADWALAEQFAKITMRQDLRTSSGEGEHGSIHDLVAYLFAAVALDDKKEFEQQHAWFNIEMKFSDMKGATFFSQYFFIYPAMMEAILNRDSQGFAKLLDQADKLFTQRGKDKKMSDLPSIEGPPGFNPLMIDYRAVALAQLAVHRGMAVDFETPALPINTLHSWESSHTH
jgi:hypothetical protein